MIEGLTTAFTTESKASRASSVSPPHRNSTPNGLTNTATLEHGLNDSNQKTINKLLDNFDPSSAKNYVLIFDIDGTLRENNSDSYIHNDAIDPKIAQVLSELNTFPNVKVVTLSSRPAYAITHSNIPANLDRLCSNGSEHLYPFDLEEDVSRKSYDLWHPKRLALTALYAVVHRVHANLKNKTKDPKKKGSSKIMKIFDEYINSKRFGIERIIKHSLRKNKKPDQVFYFGNSNSDIKGMEALKDLAIEHGFKAHCVFIKDPHDSDHRAISDKLSSFEDTHSFLYAARRKLPAQIRDNENLADSTVVTHNLQGNVIPLPRHYKDPHYDPLAQELRDRLHHKRIHNFQEFNSRDLKELIDEEPSIEGGYKLINGLHIFWAPDFNQGPPISLVDLYCDETTSRTKAEHQDRKGMQYIVTIAPTEYFKIEHDLTENSNEVKEEPKPWFRIFKEKNHSSLKDKFIHTLTGWGEKISSALAVRLKDLENRTLQIVNFHLPAVMNTSGRLNLLKSILGNKTLAVQDFATILAGDFNPLDEILSPDLFMTRASARSEESQLEQVLKEYGFESPFRNKSTTHLDKRTFLKPLLGNLRRSLDLIAINHHLKFHNIDEDTVSQKIKQYECEPRSERKRLHKNLQHPSGVSVGKWHGSDHRKVTALVDYAI